jgi:hypothetical protein
MQRSIAFRYLLAAGIAQRYSRRIRLDGRHGRAGVGDGADCSAGGLDLEQGTGASCAGGEAADDHADDLRAAVRVALGNQAHGGLVRQIG